MIFNVFRVNERRYEFGDEEGAIEWVCAKIPNDGRVKKDCVPKVILKKTLKTPKVCCITNTNIMNVQSEAPGWYLHLLENRDYQVLLNIV